MKLDVRHPLPLYRKLLLENKILFVFGLLLALLGGAVLVVQYRATARGAEGIALEHVTQSLDPFIELLGEAAADGDHGRIDDILDRAAARDRRIAYLVVADAEGRPLEVAANAEAASSAFEPLASDDETVSADVPPAGRRFIEWQFPLVARERLVGTLTAGIERERFDRFAMATTAITAAVMLGPVLLIFVVTRVVIRRAVKGLKDLIRVADEISTGNLNPRIGFGIRVNCWEIKNCGRTDCKAYMNLGRQCWYIDGTPCEGYEPRFPEKLEGCRKCEVYQLHRGDEIVQLADAFKHMTTVLKSSRDRLVSSGEFQKQLIHNSFDGIVATDADDVITIFNRIAEDLIGVSGEQVLGKRDWRAFFEDGLEKSMDLPLSHERFHRARGFAGRETKILREDGKLVDVLLSGISLFEGGRHIGKVFFFQDVREVKRLREDLIRSERLAATGQAAAGISHSIKNILDGFAGGAYVFRQGRRNDNRGKMDLGWDMIERNMQIISDLVKDLLNFSQEREPQYQSVDPAALIEDVLVNMGLKQHERVRVRVQVDEPPRRVVLDPHAFHQCLTNLVRNAAEAIPGDREGTVTIRVAIDDDRAVFSVIDDGAGMSPRTVEKIKGGMYSTKGSKGTGLGLLVIQKIVSEHKGTLAIESVEGEGSTFRIEIPTAGTSVAA
jgi:PAS domain S-box-containing protein